jgi:hypothetical protein
MLELLRTVSIGATGGMLFAAALDRRVLEWNVFGAPDLVAAVALGILSANGPLQLIHAGAGANEMATLPWALIPMVLVPTYLIGHALAFAHARAATAARTGGIHARLAQV